MVLVGIIIATGGRAFAAHPAKNKASTKTGTNLIIMNCAPLLKNHVRRQS
jgi:hypothetical protein